MTKENKAYWDSWFRHSRFLEGRFVNIWRAIHKSVICARTDMVQRDMVQRRVEIKRIEDKSKRQTTFSKRRQGLFRKAEELGKKCGIDIAIIVFSKAGNLFATGDPSVSAVINRYIHNKSSVDGKTNETNDALQVRDGEETHNKTNHANDSTLLPPLLTEKKHNEVEQILAEIEGIKNKILSMGVEESNLHGFDQAMAELDNIKGTMEQIKLRIQA